MNPIEPSIIFETKSNLDGQTIKLEWHDLLDMEIPELNWKQVHIITNFNGQVVLVYFEKLKHFHLPGGHIEPGENIESTMRREFAEETGGIILDWEPIGYQVRTDSKGKRDFQLRIYANVTDVKESNIDYDGSIAPTKFVDIKEMTKMLGWENQIGDRIVELVVDKFV